MQGTTPALICPVSKNPAHDFQHKLLVAQNWLKLYHCDYCTEVVWLVEGKVPQCGDCNKFWHNKCLQEMTRAAEAEHQETLPPPAKTWGAAPATAAGGGTAPPAPPSAMAVPKATTPLQLQQLAIAKSVAVGDLVRTFTSATKELGASKKLIAELDAKLDAAVEAEDFELAEDLDTSGSDAARRQKDAEARLSSLLPVETSSGMMTMPPSCTEYLIAIEKLHANTQSQLEARCSDLSLANYQTQTALKQQQFARKKEESEQLRHFAQQQLLDLEAQRAGLLKKRGEMERTHESASSVLCSELKKAATEKEEALCEVTDLKGKLARAEQRLSSVCTLHGKLDQQLCQLEQRFKTEVTQGPASTEKLEALTQKMHERTHFVSDLNQQVAQADDDLRILQDESDSCFGTLEADLHAATKHKEGVEDAFLRFRDKSAQLLQSLAALLAEQSAAMLASGSSSSPTTTTTVASLEVKIQALQQEKNSAAQAKEFKRAARCTAEIRDLNVQLGALQETMKSETTEDDTAGKDGQVEGQFAPSSPLSVEVDDLSMAVLTLASDYDTAVATTTACCTYSMAEACLVIDVPPGK